MKYALVLIVIGLFSLSAMARMGAEPDDLAARLTADLNLSEEQATQVTSIMAGKQVQMQKLMQQMAALREETDTAIKAVLTEEQQEKFDALRQKRHGRHHPQASQEF